jgi:dihydrofolate reductase
MRKLMMKMSVSVDGFVGAANGQIDWIFKTTDEAATAWIVGLCREAGLHIMGSKAFQDMASYWPTSTELRPCHWQVLVRKLRLPLPRP